MEANSSAAGCKFSLLAGSLMDTSMRPIDGLVIHCSASRHRFVLTSVHGRDHRTHPTLRQQPVHPCPALRQLRAPLRAGRAGSPPRENQVQGSLPILPPTTETAAAVLPRLRQTDLARQRQMQELRAEDSPRLLRRLRHAAEEHQRRPLQALPQHPPGPGQVARADQVQQLQGLGAGPHGLLHPRRLHLPAVRGTWRLPALPSCTVVVELPRAEVKSGQPRDVVPGLPSRAAPGAAP